MCFREALALLGKEKQTVPVLILEGRIYSAYPIWGKALSCFDRAISLDHNNAEALAWKGYCLTGQGKLTEALALLDRATALDPDLAVAFAFRGICVFRMGRSAEGLAQIDKALSLDQRCFSAYVALYDMHRMQLNAAGAQSDLEKLCTLYSDRPLPHVLLAALLWTEGKTEKALGECNRAVAVSPRSYAGYEERASILFKCRRYKEAIADFTEVIETDPFERAKSTAIDLRAKSFEQTGEYKQAIKDFDVELSYLPDLEKNGFPRESRDVRQVLSRALCYEKMKEYSHALHDADCAVRMSPSNTQAIQVRARLYAEMGKYSQALNDLNHLIAIDSGVPAWYRSRASLLEKLGQFQKARKDIARAAKLEHNP